MILDIIVLNIDYCKKQLRDIKEFIRLINTYFNVGGVSNKMILQELEIQKTMILKILGNTLVPKIITMIALSPVIGTLINVIVKLSQAVSLLTAICKRCEREIAL